MTETPRYSSDDRNETGVNCGNVVVAVGITFETNSGRSPPDSTETTMAPPTRRRVSTRWSPTTSVSTSTAPAAFTGIPPDLRAVKVRTSARSRTGVAVRVARAPAYVKSVMTVRTTSMRVESTCTLPAGP